MGDLSKEQYNHLLRSLWFLQIHNLPDYSVITVGLTSLILVQLNTFPEVLGVL